MPVVAIVAAAASYSAAATVFAGAAAWSATAIAAGAVMVGSAMTIAGTITGNKKLTKYGGIIGIAGGLGMGAISAFGGGLDTSAAAASNSTIGGQEAMSMDASIGAPPPTEGLAGAEAMSMDAGIADKMAGIGQSPSVAPGVNATSSMDQAIKESQQGLMAPREPSGLIDSLKKPSTTLDQAKQAVTQAASAPEGSMWDKFQAFTKAYPEMSKMGFEAFQQFAANLVQKPPTEQEAAYTALMNQRTADDKRRALAAGGYATGPNGLVNSMYYNRSSNA